MFMTSLSLHDQFRKLRLPGIMETFEARLTSARENGLSHSEWLSLLLQDEIQRREALALEKRFKKASFEQTKTFEEYEIARYHLPIQHLIRDLMGGLYLHEKSHVLAVGPTGTGKTHLAQALGHHACRQSKSVRFIRASVLLREMHASRADQSWERNLKKLSAPDLLIIDDFGLSALTLTQAEDFYELVAERHLKSSLIITSNRKVEAWVDLFPDPAMGNAVVDRLTNHSYHVILEGDSYRRKLRPKIANTKKET
jgi:DNA replication protein DnaC